MNINKLLFTSVFLTTVSGCASSVPITSPGGKAGHAIDCSFATIAECYEKAGKMCGAKGYKIIDQKNQAESLLSSANKALVVECN